MSQVTQIPGTLRPEGSAAARRSIPWHYILALALLSLITYLGTAFFPPLLDDVDSSHATVSREMLQRHDYAVLFMNGIRYLDKAPLHYWLVAGCYKLFGVSAFSTRLPDAVFMVLLTLITFEFGRFFFSDEAGFYSGLAVATSFGFFLFTRIMIPEAIYATFFVAGFYFFLRAWTGTLSTRPALWLAATAFALAVLTRGLVGLAFPGGALFLFILFRRGWSRLRQLPVLSSALLFLIIAVPWHLIAQHRAHTFLWAYFVNEQFHRAVGTRYPKDYAAVPLWLWLISHLIWLFPWSVFAPLVVSAYKRRRSGHDAVPALANDPYAPNPLPPLTGQAYTLLFCWIAVIVGFFCVFGGSRMEYYSFGCWPALALLLGAGLADAERRNSRLLKHLCIALCAIGLAFGAVLLGLVLASSSAVPSTVAGTLHTQPDSAYRLSLAHVLDLTPQTFHDLRLPAIMAAIVFIGGFGLVLLVQLRGRPRSGLFALAVSMCVFFFAADIAFASFTPVLSSYDLAQAINRYLRPEDKIVLFGEYDTDSSIAFYTGRHVYLLNGRYNNLEAGSHYPDAPHIFLTDADIARLWTNPERIFLMVPHDKQAAASRILPPLCPWILEEEANKVVYVNHQLFPGQKQIVSSAGCPASH